MDIRTAEEVIVHQFPELAPVHARYLGEGYDSVALEIAPDWVFRFPKRPDVEAQLLLEVRVLPHVAPAAPLAIPAYAFVGVPSALFPRHFAGYRKLPGEPAIGSDALAHAESVAVSFAVFLSWLHSRDPECARDAGVPRTEVSTWIDECRQESLQTLRTVTTVRNDPQSEAWKAFFDKAPESRLEEGSGVLLHGDLSAEHVLWIPETGRLAGIIDWSELCVGDAAIDLSAIYHWGGPAFAVHVLEHYVPHVDPGTMARARYLAACRGLADIVFGMETGRAEYIEGGRHALILNASAGS